MKSRIEYTPLSKAKSSESVSVLLADTDHRTLEARRRRYEEAIRRYTETTTTTTTNGGYLWERSPWNLRT